ncbi:MAG: Uma2 family endonuclease [Sphingomonadaceae bacterium]
MTVDEFLSIDFPSDKKFELVDGVIRMMAGGSVVHALVASNVMAFLRNQLRGTGCRPFGSDMGLMVNQTNLRYPDIAVYCRSEWSDSELLERKLGDPSVIFEILSPSTDRNDQGAKLDEFRTIESLQTVVFVDPIKELTRVVQRIGPTSWRDDLFAQPHDVELPSLGVTIPHAEIFARD